MKKFGKIALALMALCSIFVLTSCSFYSKNRAVAAFEFEKDLSEETGMNNTMTFQAVFNEDGTCREIVKAKFLIFTVKAVADGTWEPVQNSPADALAAMKVVMEDLSITIFGETETISEAGTYMTYVYNNKLYLGGDPDDYATIWANPAQLETASEYSLTRVYPE
ncbi:MAG: hypothetical protein K6G52_07765 [Treponemataceae bacterium]|nr:hypothetical protein [Treponemataceae bacterium]